MKRWLVLPVGLGIVAAAAWALLAGSPLPDADRRDSLDSQREEIDEESRAQLQQILREMDVEETR